MAAGSTQTSVLMTLLHYGDTEAMEMKVFFYGLWFILAS